MPSEDRYIVFNYEEVYKAIRIRKITEGQELPPDGEISQVKFNQSSDGTIITLTLKMAGGGFDYLELDRTFFAMALVFFCQGNSIPIPKAGKKEIIAKDDTIIMHIALP